MRGAFAAACCALIVQAQQPARDTRPAAATPASATIDGMVVTDEEQPKPLRRAIVTLSGGDVSGGRTAITDDNGRFQFDGLGAGQFGLAAIKEGYVPRAFGSSREVPRGRGAPQVPATLVLHAGEVRTITMRLPRGAVITGSVTDGGGQPVPGAIVIAFADRFEAATGARRLRLTEGATTDDRGEYRIFGLPAGQYLVYAQVTTAFDAKVVKRTTSDTRSVVTANTYYPSTPDGARATRITVAAGEERAGIDIQAQYVQTAGVEGVVSGGNGSPNGVVTLLRSNEPMSASLLAGISSIGSDGQFTFSGVAPGRYELRTQSASTASPSGGSAERTWMWGSTDVVVDGEDVTNVGIQLMPTFTISGRIVFEGSTPPPPLGAMPLPASIASTMANRTPPALQLLEGGKFMMSGLTPGVYRPAAIGSPLRGLQVSIGPWWLKSIALDGRELLDAPLELRQASENALVTFSDRASEVTGSVKDASGAPVARGNVVIFSADRAHWFVNSRRVVAVAPGQNGRYSIRNLPPGEYRAAVAMDLEQGEWFDPDVLQRLLPDAFPFTIAGAEAKTLDLILR